MPNRIIKESICTSDSIDGLSWFEECFFYRLIVSCDDYGRMDARPPILRARLFPLKTVTDKQVEAALQSLRTAAMIDLYVVDGHSYLQLRTWGEHQRIRNVKEKYPAPDFSNSPQLAADCGRLPLAQAQNPIQSESESESNPNPKSSARASRFAPPSVDEVRDFCRENFYDIDAEQFVNFYTSKGWKVGKDPMKDWKAAVRTWVKRNKQDKRGRGQELLDMIGRGEFDD